MANDSMAKAKRTCPCADILELIGKPKTMGNKILTLGIVIEWR